MDMFRGLVAGMALAATMTLRADVDVCAGSIMARADALADYLARWDETATDLATGRLKLAQLVEAARAIKEDARAIKARLGIE